MVKRERDHLHRAGAGPSLRAFREEVVEAIGAKNLVDVRSPDEFSGKLLAPAHLPQEQAQRRRPHPHARSTCRGARPRTRTAPSAPTPSWASSTARPGLDESKSTIAYCRIGERSSHTWFVLHELLGHADVKNYDGSWTEYGSLVGVPVETGSEVRRTLTDGAAPPNRARRCPPASTRQGAVLAGKVSADGAPVGGAFVRLLDSTGEFTAEVVSSAEGDFRFFAAPGRWTVRALHRTGNGEAR